MPKRHLQGIWLLAMTLSPAAGATLLTADDVPVYLNGELLLRFRTWTADYSPSARADLFEQRLRACLDDPSAESATVTIHNDQGRPTLLLGDQRLVTVTTADAIANESTAWRLARAWRDNLAQAMAALNGAAGDHRTVTIERTPPPQMRLTMLDRPLPAPTSTRSTFGPASGATDPTLNGVELFTFRADAGGYTAEQRYITFQRNLQRALDQPVERRDVQLRSRRGLPTLYLANQYLCTVTGADAAANHTTPWALAQIWAGNLRRAVAGIDRH